MLYRYKVKPLTPIPGREARGIRPLVDVILAEETMMLFA
jgi:hypothetical protein